MQLLKYYPLTAKSSSWTDLINPTFDTLNIEERNPTVGCRHGNGMVWDAETLKKATLTQSVTQSARQRRSILANQIKASLFNERSLVPNTGCPHAFIVVY